MIGGAGTLPAVTLAEAQAFVRIETGEEEAILAGLVRSASALCEAFIGQVVVMRDVAEEVPASTTWQRLAAAPVRSIGTVEGVAADGSATVLAGADYAVDIDAHGNGWVRIVGSIAAVRCGFMRASGWRAIAMRCLNRCGRGSFGWSGICSRRGTGRGAILQPR